MAGVVQVFTDDVVCFFGPGWFPVTVAVFVTQTPAAAGAVPVTTMTKLLPSARAPSVHCTALPVATQPGVTVLTLVIPAGSVSFTTKPELLPGPLFVTVICQVMTPPWGTVFGPVFEMVSLGGFDLDATPFGAAPAEADTATAPAAATQAVRSTSERRRPGDTPPGDEPGDLNTVFLRSESDAP